MAPLTLLACVALACVASVLATVVDPRGARPVEPATRSETCAAQKEWPFCSDDDWGFKCPSGCRIQGLMDMYDHSLLKKIERIRSLLDHNKAKHRSADQVTKQTYDYLKEKLGTDAGNDNSYYDLAQSLRQSITEMKIKIDSQLRRMDLLVDRVKNQVVEMQRMEVDIDIKLRSCKGSCLRYTEHQVDKESYVNLEKQISQLGSRSQKNIESVGTLYVMKSRPLQDVVVDSIYKSKDTDGRVAAQQKEDMFPDVKTVQLLLEHEGSSSSPATISKVTVCMRVKPQSLDDQQCPRNNRTFRGQQCRTKSDLALCSDDDWVSKCPSGCRLQGLISQMESEVERKLWKVCQTAKKYEDAAAKATLATTHIYSSNRRTIVTSNTQEVKFVAQADRLSRNLTSLRKRSWNLSQKIKELQTNVEKQVEDLYRTEVDIDMKLRACHGSCGSVLPFTVNHLSYQELQTAVNQRSKVAPPSKQLPHIRLQPVDAGAASSVEQKTSSTVQRQLPTQAEGIPQHRLVLDELMEDASVDIQYHAELE